MYVVKIEHKTNPFIQIKSITNTVFPYTKIKYVVGTIVESDMFDENIYNSCSYGIHYFKAKICALCYEPECLEKLGYTGAFYNFDESGQKKEAGYYENGKKVGDWIIYATHDFNCDFQLSFIQICKIQYFCMFDQQITKIIPYDTLSSACAVRY
jgi:hypothetical protein